MWLHIVEIEVGCTFDDGVPLAKELLVARVEIVLPQMGGKPSTTIRIHTPEGAIHRTSNAPDIRIVVCHPTIASIHLLGSHSTRLTQVFNHRKERFGGLRQVAHLSRPVVHLSIDVDGVFGIPRSIALVVPYALQIGRLTTRLGRRDEQIASIVE